MPITTTPNGDIIVTGRSSIELFRLITLRARLKLEIAGLKFRGPTSYSILKRELQLKGSRESVLEQVTAILNTTRANAAGATQEQ